MQISFNRRRSKLSRTISRVYIARFLFTKLVEGKISFVRNEETRFSKKKEKSTIWMAVDKMFSERINL